MSPITQDEVDHLESICGLESDKNTLSRFEKEHLGSVQLLEDDYERYLARPGMLDRFKALSDLGPAMTMFRDETVVGCMGLASGWPGVADVWVIVSRMVLKAPIVFHRVCDALLIHFAGRMDLHRVQSTVDKTHGRALRWALSMGFEPESTLVDYGPNREDHIMVVRRFGGDLD